MLEQYGALMSVADVSQPCIKHDGFTVLQSLQNYSRC